MLNAIIIDDEDHARAIVKFYIEEFAPEIKILGEANSVRSALVLIAKTKPDIVFLDVCMGDGSGFDFLEQLKERNCDIVFITAHDEYAIKAFKHNAIDYLLKPLQPDEFIATVQKISNKKKDKSVDNSRYEQLLQNLSRTGSNRIAVPDIKGITYVESSDILFFQSANKYTIIKLNSGGEIVSTKTLKDFEEILNSINFCRVHNTHFVNLRYVVRYIRGEGGFVIMKNGTQIEVSRRKKSELMEKMNLSL